MCVCFGGGGLNLIFGAWFLIITPFSFRYEARERSAVADTDGHRICSLEQGCFFQGQKGGRKGVREGGRAEGRRQCNFFFHFLFGDDVFNMTPMEYDPFYN